MHKIVLRIAKTMHLCKALVNANVNIIQEYLHFLGVCYNINDFRS